MFCFGSLSWLRPSSDSRERSALLCEVLLLWDPHRNELPASQARPSFLFLEEVRIVFNFSEDNERKSFPEACGGPASSKARVLGSGAVQPAAHLLGNLLSLRAVDPLQLLGAVLLCRLRGALSAGSRGRGSFLTIPNQLHWGKLSARSLESVLVCEGHHNKIPWWLRR